MNHSTPTTPPTNENVCHRFVSRRRVYMPHDKRTRTCTSKASFEKTHNQQHMFVPIIHLSCVERIIYSTPTTHHDAASSHCYVGDRIFADNNRHPLNAPFLSSVHMQHYYNVVCRVQCIRCIRYIWFIYTVYSIYLLHQLSI